MSNSGLLHRPCGEGETNIWERSLTNTVDIRTTADDLWRALTNGDQSVKYVGARVQSTWRPGDEIVYLSPDSSTRLAEGTLLEVEPKHRFVFECRLLMDPALAADRPHREAFEIEDLGDVCRCTATFDQYAVNSPALRFQGQGSMQMCGSSLKSLLWRLAIRSSSAMARRPRAPVRVSHRRPRFRPDRQRVGTNSGLRGGENAQVHADSRGCRP